MFKERLTMKELNDRIDDCKRELRDRYNMNVYKHITLESLNNSISDCANTIKLLKKYIKKHDKYIKRRKK